MAFGARLCGFRPWFYLLLCDQVPWLKMEVIIVPTLGCQEDEVNHIWKADPRSIEYMQAAKSYRRTRKTKSLTEGLWFERRGRRKPGLARRAACATACISLLSQPAGLGTRACILAGGGSESEPADMGDPPSLKLR